MGYLNKSMDKRWGLPMALTALVLGLVFFGSGAGPAPVMAGTIACEGCHSKPPSDSDSDCAKQTSKSHPVHATSDENTCARCHIKPSSLHPSLTHNNNIINITSVMAPGLHYNTTNSTCANACHKNRNSTWGGTGDCNLCHFRNGALGFVDMSGLHVTADRSWKHFSSVVKVSGQSITCNNCHPNNDSDTGMPKSHISSQLSFAERANMARGHDFATVTGIGYTKGAFPSDATCLGSCHYNVDDTYGNYTICFKPGQKIRFGAYQTARWGEPDLKCNECHSTPGKDATFGGTSSTHANKRHYDHMFRFKLNPWNFQSEFDRSIYCDDCHKTPDTTFGIRGFLHHSTVGAGGSGIISLPVKSRTSKVYMQWRNDGKGRDGINPPQYDTGSTSCTNVYCHTIMVSGTWTEEGCNACHGENDGVNTGSGAPGFTSLTAFNSYAFESYSGGGGAHFSHVTRRGYPCRTCHFDGGGDGIPGNHHNNFERIVFRDEVNVGVDTTYRFNNLSGYYDRETRACKNVKCHYGASQNWDCDPLH